MVVIDCDVVQMPRGEWETETNVTYCPLYKRPLEQLFSQREGGKGSEMAGM